MKTWDKNMRHWENNMVTMVMAQLGAKVSGTKRSVKEEMDEAWVIDFINDFQFTESKLEICFIITQS